MGRCKCVHSFIGFSEEFRFHCKGNRKLLKGSTGGCLPYGEGSLGKAWKQENHWEAIAPQSKLGLIVRCGLGMMEAGVKGKLDRIEVYFRGSTYRAHIQKPYLYLI